MKYIFILLFILPALSRGQVITTVAGGATGHGGYWGEGGPATASQIGGFGGIATDSYGNLYISIPARICKIDAITGIITTIAGTGIAGYNGDSIQATAAQLNANGWISIDQCNNLYINDSYNYRTRKVNLNTGIITTFIGNGIFGSSGDGGPATAAEIKGGGGVMDNFGNYYFLEYRKIRKVDSAGIITTICGTGSSGITGDGVPALGTPVYPQGGIGTDALGNIYFGDTTRAIRKITVSTGIITRVAGTGDNISTPYSGDGVAATTCHLGSLGITVDDAGNIYIADMANSRIEKVDALTGLINTVAGTGTVGFSGDGNPATSAEIHNPEGVVLDSCSNIYVADFGNARARKITINPLCSSHGAISSSCTPHIKSTSINEAGNVSSSLYISPNPCIGKINISYSVPITSIAILNLLNQIVYSNTYNSKTTQIDISGLSQGLYFLKINNSEIRKIIKQ